MRITKNYLENKNTLSLFEKNLQRGISEKIIRISENGKKYIYPNISKNEKDFTHFITTEEKVRASFFVELILDYGYPQHLLDLEVTTPHRNPKHYADIVVFKDEENKSPYIVIEIKKDGISHAEEEQAIEQTHSYAGILKAKFCLLVSGTTKIAYDLRNSKAFERNKNKISSIPKYQEKEPPKFIFIKKEQDLEELNKEDLIKILKKCNNTIWQGGKLDPTDAFDEVSKLLFCKIKDEKDTLNNQKYNFQVGTGESIEEVAQRIKDIYQAAKEEDEEVFKDDIKLHDEIIYSIVEKIQNVNFIYTDLDTKGVAFEIFMEDFFKGKWGQFFTPREIIDFCVQMLDIKSTDKVLDTSCGSGGFLLACLNKVRHWAAANLNEIEAYSKWHHFAKNNLYGIEINERIARVCKMNMIIHDDGHTNIISVDGLEDFKTYNEKFQKQKFDKILTNPPFGAMVKSNEKKEGYLEKFTGLVKKKKNQKTEILFIVRCWEFLKPDGKMAIVLPDGILTNSSLQYVRDFIVEKFQISAVVSIPKFAFSHFGAGVKTSLLFLRKRKDNESPEQTQKEKIFMAIANRIGYDATGRKDKENDFENILIQYRDFCLGKS